MEYPTLNHTSETACKPTLKGLLLLALLALTACNSKPKVIEAEGGQQNGGTIFQDPGEAHAGHNHNAAPAGEAQTGAEEHKAVVEEVLHTEKYTYLRVNENNEARWIAIPRREIKTGTTCFYRGGLMKRNFYSKEFDRTFDTVYLVGDFREENAAATNVGATIPATKAPLDPPKDLKPAPGAIRIADLVANLKKYEGKTVKITGKCVKVNPMIMGRNWLHLQDGSGKNLDLTVTTTEMVQLGSIVTLEGTIALNKDFGAGYRYDYIMEAAVMK